jgi:hypothetical protein
MADHAMASIGLTIKDRIYRMEITEADLVVWRFIKPEVVVLGASRCQSILVGVKRRYPHQSIIRRDR